MERSAMLRTRLVLTLCLAGAFSAAAQARATSAPGQPTAEQRAAVARAKGLAGTWDCKFAFKGRELGSMLAFDVDDVATPPPEVRVRFHGALYGKNSPEHKLRFTD